MKTREQFDREQAAKQGITVEQFRESYPAEPCNCGESYCGGWWMGPLMGHGSGRPMGILSHNKLKFYKSEGSCT